MSELIKKAIELKNICETTGECICCPREAKKACKDLCDYGAICWLTDIDTHELVEYLKRKDDEEH